MSVHRTSNGNWYAKWYESGKSKKKYFGHGDAGQLRAEAQDREIKQSKGKLHDPVSLTVLDVCEEYRKLHPVAATTRKQNAYRFVNHIYRLLGRFGADQLTTRELDLYARKRSDQEGVKRSTISSELRLLKAVYSWASTQQPPLITSNMIAGYKIKTAGDEKGVPIPPTEEEVRRILAHAAPHLARAIKILWATGIRPGGELSRLKGAR